MDLPSDTVSKFLIKCFLSWLALVMMSLHGNREVRKTLDSAPTSKSEARMKESHYPQEITRQKVSERLREVESWSSKMLQKLRVLVHQKTWVPLPAPP